LQGFEEPSAGNLAGKMAGNLAGKKRRKKKMTWHATSAFLAELAATSRHVSNSVRAT